MTTTFSTALELGFKTQIKAMIYFAGETGCTQCVIFTILVSFSWDNALFASKAKINVV